MLSRAIDSQSTGMAGRLGSKLVLVEIEWTEL